MRITVILVLLGLCTQAFAQSQHRPISVLIVDGMNNHDWQRGTQIMKAILLRSGMFSPVDVSTSPPTTQPSEAAAWDAWRPDFSKYNVVVINFNGGYQPKTGVHWPHELETSFENYVRNGGGVVMIHAANNSFPNWPAYNDMIGLGWRSKDFGPSIVIDKDEKIVEIPAGQGVGPGHPKEQDFVVHVLTSDHPITQGMPRTWLHPHEQLTHGQHGPAKNMTILTYAFAPDQNANQPMDWVIPFGKGRVYTTMLGHLWKDGPDTALSCVGFQTLLIRGTEWAATGNVTYAIPEDFPTADQIKTRPTTQPEAR